MGDVIQFGGTKEKTEDTIDKVLPSVNTLDDWIRGRKDEEEGDRFSSTLHAHTAIIRHLSHIMDVDTGADKAPGEEKTSMMTKNRLILRKELDDMVSFVFGCEIDVARADDND
jgi:hypothetical protein